MKTRSSWAANTSRRWHLGAALAIAAVALTACASTSSPSNSTAQSTSTGGSGGGSTTVMVKSGPLGDYLTDGSGRTLYVYANDTSTKSTCTGACATFWPPLTGPATAGSGAQQGMLGTTARDDGSTQVTYNGHPLYYFKQDTAAGDSNGQGQNLNGGLWWIVSSAGAPITGAAPSQSSSGGGGGGWS
jgi:predicted lipoprotein with Yx(FWY)xxD motif